MSSQPPTPSQTPRPTPAPSPGFGGGAGGGGGGGGYNDDNNSIPPTPTPTPTPSPGGYGRYGGYIPTPSSSQEPPSTARSSRSQLLVGSTPRGDISRGTNRIVNHASMASIGGSISSTPQTPNIRDRGRNAFDNGSDGNFSEYSQMGTPAFHNNRVLVHGTPQTPSYGSSSSSAASTPSFYGGEEYGLGRRGGGGSGYPDDYDDIGGGGFETQPATEAFIWGTTVNVDICFSGFRRFIEDFYLDENDIEPYYIRQLRALERSGSNILNINCQHLYNTIRYRQLYHQLVQFPQEIIPIMDAVANEEYNNMHGRQAHKVLRTCTFGLIESKRMRALDPSNIDTLVSIKGMITRCSTIIPDIKQAFFRCTRCPQVTEVMIDRGRIEEPTQCPSCQTKNSMEIIHNRCLFSDKQMIRMQETSEEVPEGEMPYSTSIFAFDDLVDSVRPGDRIEVTGIYRAMPKRPNPRMRTIKSVYKTYIDCIHFRRIDAGDSSSASTHGGSNSTTASSNSMAAPAFAEEKVILFKRFSQQDNVYDQLVAGLAPSIWELDDVKRGVLCMLFGGNTPEAVKLAGKTLSEEDPDGPDDGEKNDSSRKVESRQRNEVNILLCGDPGTSKSQLLSYVHKLSPRGIYTSGRGSSAVGLTASVVRDTESKELVLESGALVLSDNGICCIDEFDKMTDTTRAILHEAMEQQTVSITKAGIVATLNARTAILASANPVESRYNPRLSVVENIKLPPTLLSRFDLIYLILDKPNPEQDRKLAKHIVSLYYDKSDDSNLGARSRQNSSGQSNSSKSYVDENNNIICNQEFIKEYVLYARTTIAPDLSEEAKQALVDGYLAMRGAGMHKNGNKTITATTRQLESLIRISQAMAKMRLQRLVSREDVLESIRLMRVATQTAATDPRTGTIDIDMITTGRSSIDRDLIVKLVAELRTLLKDRHGDRMTISQIRQIVLTNINQNNGNVGNSFSSSNAMGSSHNDRGDITTVSVAEIEEAVRDLQAEGVLQFLDSAQMVIIR